MPRRPVHASPALPDLTKVVPAVWCASWFQRDRGGAIVGDLQHCALRDQPKPGREPRYRDHLRTLCREVITLPGTMTKRVPTCTACIVRLAGMAQVRRVELATSTDVDAMVAKMLGNDLRTVERWRPAWAKRPCPSCGVGQGVRCVDADGRSMRISHRVRCR